MTPFCWPAECRCHSSFARYCAGRFRRDGWMAVRSSLGAGWWERERERERVELSVNQHHGPTTNDANLL